MLLFGVTHCDNYLFRLWFVIKQSHLCYVVSKQPIELSSLKIELVSKTYLHYVTPISNMQLIGIINV